MLISEGRKEDVYKKFKNVIEVERKLSSSFQSLSIYDVLIKDPYIQQTNYKFLEPLIKQFYVYNHYIPREGKELEELEPNTIQTATSSNLAKKNFVTEIIPLLRFFENNKDKYVKKDLNQYVGEDFDKNFFDLTKDLMKKSEEKKEKEIAGKNVDKIYEDNHILVVSPKTHQASCYYGAGTRWCVSMRDRPSYFGDYTIDSKLYFVILKGKSKENVFYKIAINVKLGQNVVDGSFWDSQDIQLSSSETKMFLSLIPDEVVSKIQEDIDKSTPNVIETLSEQIIDKSDYYRFIKIQNYIFRMEYEDFYPIDKEKTENSLKFGFSYRIILDSYIPYGGDKMVKNEDSSYMYQNGEGDGEITYYSDSKNLQILIGLLENDGFGYSFYYDAIHNLNNGFKFSFSSIMDSFALSMEQNLRYYLYEKGLIRKMDREIRKEPEKFGSYADYTFNRKGQQITKLYDILDKLDENETIKRNDFLMKSGIIKMTPEGPVNKKNVPIKLQSYLSNWFSALNDAGIIENLRGRGFKKGPRYEEFRKKIFG